MREQAERRGGMRTRIVSAAAPSATPMGAQDGPIAVADGTSAMERFGTAMQAAPSDARGEYRLTLTVTAPQSNKITNRETRSGSSRT